MSPIERFFAYAAERHAIYLRRQMGIPKGQLTDDIILRTYRFCNVFRELDTTTIWLRENVRDPLRAKPEVLLATALFRWFNRVQTGEAIFSQTCMIPESPRSYTVWEQFLETGDIVPLKTAIIAFCGAGPYVTGSYIIKTPDGRSKLDGVLWCVREFSRSSHTLLGQSSDWRSAADQCLASGGTVSLRDMWRWLLSHTFLGPFMAYEIVSDLRYTDLLCNAPDILTWANPGPGAIRGLNRIAGRPLDSVSAKDIWNEEMQNLLRISYSSVYWPRWNGQAYESATGMPSDADPWQPDSWPVWDMRTVEHTLCEFDKYERVRLGQGAPRQKFR